jgi:hypothetical protein
MNMNTLSAKAFLEYAVHTLHIHPPSTTAHWLQFADRFGDHKKKEALSGLTLDQKRDTNLDISALLDSLGAVLPNVKDESVISTIELRISELIEKISI